MTLDIQSIEALAHYTRGGVTIFFVFWCFLLRKYEKRSYEAALFFIGSHCCLLCQRRAVRFHVDKIFHPLEQHLRHIGHGLHTRDFRILPRSGSTGSSFHAADMGFGGVSRVVCPYLRFLALQGD